MIKHKTDDEMLWDKHVKVAALEAFEQIAGHDEEMDIEEFVPTAHTGHALPLQSCILLTDGVALCFRFVRWLNTDRREALDDSSSDEDFEGAPPLARKKSHSMFSRQASSKSSAFKARRKAGEVDGAPREIRRSKSGNTLLIELPRSVARPLRTPRRRSVPLLLSRASFASLSVVPTAAKGRCVRVHVVPQCARRDGACCAARAP
jgi:hypothetical protein